MTSIDFFNRIAEFYPQQLSSFWLKQIRKIEITQVSLRLNRSNYSSILELGCGSGFYTDLLSTKTTDLSCVDASEKMLTHIQIPGVHKICQDVEKLNLKRKFNLIFSYGLSEFIKNPKLFILNIYQHLENKGQILISFPLYNLGGLLYFWHYKRKGISIKIFKKNEILNLFENSRLKITSVHYIFPMNFLVHAEKS